MSPKHMFSLFLLLSLSSSQVLPILEILYHVEDRNSHHVYMALIILLILTEDDAFNRSIHEVVGTCSLMHVVHIWCIATASSHYLYQLG